MSWAWKRQPDNQQPSLLTGTLYDVKKKKKNPSRWVGWDFSVSALKVSTQKQDLSLPPWLLSWYCTLSSVWEGDTHVLGVQLMSSMYIHILPLIADVLVQSDIIGWSWVINMSLYSQYFVSSLGRRALFNSIIIISIVIKISLSLGMFNADIWVWVTPAVSSLSGSVWLLFHQGLHFSASIVCGCQVLIGRPRRGWDCFSLWRRVEVEGSFCWCSRLV